MAQFAIVNKNDLNECWSADQYTGNCHLCKKVLECRINSQHHVNGILQVTANRNARLKEEIVERAVSIEQDKNNALKRLK